MRRPFTTLTCALMVAMAPAVAFAQTQPPAQPAQQPPPAAQTTKAPTLAFTTDAGLVLIQIKKDQTAAFEDLLTRLRAGVAKTTDEAVKKQMAGFKVYKATEDMAGNALYVCVIDPTTKDVDYELFSVLQKVLTADELRDAAVIEMSKKAAAAFAQGYNKLTLTPLGGGM
jgi:hypothetical protein